MDLPYDAGQRIDHMVDVQADLPIPVSRMNGEPRVQIAVRDFFDHGRYPYDRFDDDPRNQNGEASHDQDDAEQNSDSYVDRLVHVGVDLGGRHGNHSFQAVFGIVW